MIAREKIMKFRTMLCSTGALLLAAVLEANVSMKMR